MGIREKIILGILYVLTLFLVGWSKDAVEKTKTLLARKEWQHTVLKRLRPLFLDLPEEKARTYLTVCLAMLLLLSREGVQALAELDGCGRVIAPTAKGGAATFLALCSQLEAEYGDGRWYYKLTNEGKRCYQKIMRMAHLAAEGSA